jgi:hypothetical protein
MKTKKRVLVFVVVLILVALNILYFTKFQGAEFLIGASISGNSIVDFKERIGEVNYSIVFFSIQWIIVMVICLFAYLKHIRKRKKEKAKILLSQQIRKNKKSQTDFDILHQLLEQDTSLSTKTISEIFKIKKDTALEWSKILEENNLVSIEYPAFGDPEVIIAGKNKNKGEKPVNKKNDKQKIKPEALNKSLKKKIDLSPKAPINKKVQTKKLKTIHKPIKSSKQKINKKLTNKPIKRKKEIIKKKKR